MNTLNLTGYLLAGGRSSRMGTDKALLELDGETLIERGVRTLSAVCADVWILGGTLDLDRFGQVLPDRLPGAGPLGGIVTALEHTATEQNVILAVDMPFLTSDVLQTLRGAAARSGSPAVIAVSAGRPQPLCGVYAKRLLPVLRQELDAGRGKIMSALLAAGHLEEVHFADEKPFRNLNTPEELALARSDL